MPLSGPGRSFQTAALGSCFVLGGIWMLPPAHARKPLSSAAIRCEQRGAEAPLSHSELPLAQPHQSLWASALRRVGVIPSDQTNASQAAAHWAACSRTKLDGCSALSPRQPDPSWASPQSLQGMPKTLRLKAEPCVDTWYRLVGRRDGWVRFDITRTDRRPERLDPRWLAPLGMEVSCAALHSKVENVLVPIRPGSLAWVGAQIFC